MGYSWFRVDSAFPDHPKTLALCAELDDPNAGMYVIRLWSWAQRYASSGRVDAASRHQLERSLGWTKEPGKLVSALVKFGWMEARNDCFVVHDWDLHQSALVQKSNRDAEVKAEARRIARAHQLHLVPETGAKTAPKRRAPKKQPALATDVTRRTDGTDETQPPPTKPTEPMVVVENEFWAALVAAFESEGVAVETQRPKTFAPWCTDRHAAGFTPRDAYAGCIAFLRDDDIRGKAIAVFISHCWESRMKRLGPESPPVSITPLEAELERRIEPIRVEGFAYAASQLRELTPVAIVGEWLQVRPHSKGMADWVMDHYAAHLKTAKLELLMPAERVAN